MKEFEDKQLVRKLLRCLTAREEFVIRQRFELGACLEDAAKALQVTRERVRLIEHKALRKMRRMYTRRYRSSNAHYEY